MNTETQGTRLLVLEAVRNFPKSSPHEISVLLTNDGVPKDNIKQMLGWLYNKGVLDREAGPYPPRRVRGRRPYLYSIAENPQPRERAPSTGRTKKPSAAGFEARIAAMQAKIAELEDWKTQAIRRYPDLAIPDVVLRARKIVAGQLESHDSHGKAETLAGRRDQTMLIKAVVAALESA